MNRQLKVAHLEILSTADLTLENLADRPQVEVVDFVLKLKTRLEDVNLQMLERERIQVQLNNVMDSVDEELRSVLLSNGSLREAFEI